jgi:hypothetical protein
MNPELRRNLWLELTPRRMLMMAALLALAFFAAALAGGEDAGPSSIALVLYYVIVVLWGTRNAALSVVGEIRDRTWDAQRLSSLGADAMTWGKLFGSTAYNWFGGIICLVVLVAGIAAHQGPAVAAVKCVYYLAIGILAQMTAFLASLIGVRRRRGHSRLEIFVYQLVGLASAVIVNRVWTAADPAGAVGGTLTTAETVVWWGQSFNARAFLLVSLVVFAVWIYVACYREMRRELQMHNGPFVWLGFLAFIGLYVAGFDAWLNGKSPVGTLDQTGLRVGLAFSTYVILTYVMVVLEPKDMVQYRWLGSQVRSGRIGSALGSAQSWMMSYAAALATGVALSLWMGNHLSGTDHRLVLAAILGFVTRDVLIVILIQTFSGRTRGDFAAVAILVALYGLIPAILMGLHLDAPLVAFYPRDDVAWLSPVVAWGEAIFVGVLALSRLSLGDAREAAVAS